MIELTYPKPNEIVLAAAIPWRVIAVARTLTNKNTDIRFKLNNTVVGTDTSAIATVENGIKYFNYQYSVPLKEPGEFTITAEEIDTKLQTVRSTAAVNFSVIVAAGAPVSSPPATSVTSDTLWKVDASDRLIPKKVDRTVRVKRIEAGEISVQNPFANPEWKIKLGIDSERWLTTTDESSANSFASLRVNNLQVSGALTFEDFSLISAPLEKQPHWDGETYEWRLVGTWEGEEGAILVRRAKVADRALTADSAKSIAWSETTIVPVLPGIAGEVNFRSCGNDLWKIKVDCLLELNGEYSKTLCQFPNTFPRLYLSEKAHIKDLAYGKSPHADFAHLHKDTSGEMILSFDRPIVGLVRCIGSWVI